MRIELSRLARLSNDEQKNTYLQIPQNVSNLMLVGNFDKGHYSALEALCYLPKHIDHVTLHVECRRYTRQESYSVQTGFGMGERTVTRYRDGETTYDIGGSFAKCTSFLPRSVRSLTISFSQAPSYHKAYNINPLIDAIKACPNTITALNLSEIYLQSIQGYYLSKLLHALPKTLDTIHLGVESSGLDWVRHSLTLIPERVATIYLQNSVIFDIMGTPADQARMNIFSSLKRNLNRLILNGNKLYLMHENHIAALFSQLPPDLAFLSLVNNGLGQMGHVALSTILNSLPSTLATLGLSMNNLAILPPQDLAQVLTAIPPSVTFLGLSNNGLLLLAPHALEIIFSGLPATIKRIKLHETALHGMSGSELSQRFNLLPAHINILDLSDSNFLGLSIEQLIIALSGLPETIDTLDLSYNNLHRKTGEELAQLFRGLPIHIKKVILKGNQLASMSMPVLKQGLHALAPQISSIDVSDNGLDRMLPSRFSHFQSAIPSSIKQVIFDKEQFAIQNNGALVASPPTRNYPGLFRPLEGVRSQKQIAQLKLVMLQFLRTSSLPLEIVWRIFSYVIGATQREDKYLYEQLTTPLIPNKRPVLITPSLQHEVLDVANIRISTSFENRRLDLSFCGLNRINNMSHLKALIMKISPTTTELNLKNNGFGQTPQTRAFIALALAHIPVQITYIDLSGNGFDNDTSEQLRQLFLHVPSTVKLVSLGQERPLKPATHIELRKWPKSYQELISGQSDVMQQARAILNDYTKGNSPFRRAMYFHWNRHHSVEISRLVAFIDKGLVNNINDLLSELHLIDKGNEIGSLAKRINFLTYKPSRPAEEHDDKDAIEMVNTM